MAHGKWKNLGITRKFMSWLCLDNNMLMWSFGIAVELLTIAAPCDNPIFQVENRDDLQVQWSTLNVPKASILLVCHFPHWRSFTCNITQWQPRCWRDFLAMDEGTWSHPVWKYTGRIWKRQLLNPQPQCNQEKQHLLPYITTYYQILPYISYICRQSQSPNTKSHPPDINGSTAVTVTTPAFSSASWPDQRRRVDPGGQFSKNSGSDFFRVPKSRIQSFILWNTIIS